MAHSAQADHRDAAARRVALTQWATAAAAIWLTLFLAHTAAFVAVGGTGWANPLLPWSMRVALVLVGALALMPLACLLAVAAWLCGATGYRRSVKVARVTFGIALAAMLVFLYVASWATFENVGEFIDPAAWQFWISNPLQNLRYTHDLAPRTLLTVPLVSFACVLFIVTVGVTTEHVRRISRRVLLGIAAAAALAAIASVPITAHRLRTDRKTYLDPSTGMNWNLLGLYAKVRRDKTDPVLHFAASVLDASRGDEIARPSARYSVSYPLVADFDQSPAAQPHLALRPNVVVILMESVRADRIAAYRDGRPVMPAVAELARESRSYSRAYSVAPQTNYAAPAVLSAQYPMRSTDYFTYPKEIRFPHKFIYQQLHEQGYRTGFFSSDDENWGGKLNYLDTTSLSRFFHAESSTGASYRPSGSVVMTPWLAMRHAGLLDDDETVTRALAWADTVINEPFFLFVSLQNTHAPYEIPAAFHAPFGSPSTRHPTVRFSGVGPDSLPAVIDAYDNSLAYDDTKIAEVLAYLKAHNAWDNTLLVVTSDHGESLDEHGVGVHGSALYEEQIRIPLIIHAPGLSAGSDTTLASIVDIVPTLLDILGLPADPAYEGTSLLRPVPTRAIFAVVQTNLGDQYGMVEGDWKLFYDRSTHRYSLFDLATDSAEQHDLAQTSAERRDRMAEWLNTWRWAHLRYYTSAILRARFFAPRITPCPSCVTALTGDVAHQ